MSAYEKYDIDTLISLSSDIYDYGGEDYAENYFKANVGGDHDTFEASVGRNYKLSYKIEETYKLSGRSLDKLLSEIETLYPEFDNQVIEQIMEADVVVTAKQRNLSSDLWVRVTMTKEHGKWRLLYLQ